MADETKKKCSNHLKGCKELVQTRGNLLCEKCLLKLKGKNHQELKSIENTKGKEELSSLINKLTMVEKKYSEELSKSILECEILKDQVENLKLKVGQLELDLKNKDLVCKSLVEENTRLKENLENLGG